MCIPIFFIVSGPLCSCACAGCLHCPCGMLPHAPPASAAEAAATTVPALLLQCGEQENTRALGQARFCANCGTKVGVSLAADSCWWGAQRGHSAQHAPAPARPHPVRAPACRRMARSCLNPTESSTSASSRFARCGRGILAAWLGTHAERQRREPVPLEWAVCSVSQPHRRPLTHSVRSACPADRWQQALLPLRHLWSHVPGLSAQQASAADGGCASRHPPATNRAVSPASGVQLLTSQVSS